jgi:hypothetical protein
VHTATPKPSNITRQLLHIDFNKPINEALFFPERDHAEGTCFNRFLGFIASATQTIDVCVFTITDGRITAVLRAKQESVGQQHHFALHCIAVLYIWLHE